MTFLDWIAKILQPPEIKGNKTSISGKAITNITLFPIIIVNNPKLGKVNIDASRKEVVLNESKLSPVESKQLQEYTRKEFKSKNDILKPEPVKTVLRYQTARTAPDYESFIQYFKEILPPADITILRAALFIHSEFINHRDVSYLKAQLLNRYGMRALTISNFLSVGYFDSYIKPMYEEMKRGQNYSHKRFLELYDDIIINSPFAIFVHRQMKEKDLEEHINRKLLNLAKHGMKTLNIHGIGHENVATIKKAIEKAEKRSSFNKEIIEQNNIINAKLHLP